MIEAHSATWEAVSLSAKNRIAIAQVKLEKPGTDIASTEYERGYIAAMRDILRLADPPRPPAKPKEGFSGY
jgi:hypothetical protein